MGIDVLKNYRLYTDICIDKIVLIWYNKGEMRQNQSIDKPPFRGTLTERAYPKYSGVMLLKTH